MAKTKKTLNFIYIVRELGLPTPVLIIDCEDVTKLTENKRDKVLMQKFHIPITNAKEVAAAMFNKNTMKIGDFKEIPEGDYDIHAKECSSPCGYMACNVWESCMSPEWQGATIKIPEVPVSENRPPETHYDWQQRLFNYMSEQHNLILVQSEMEDIKSCIIKEFYPQTFTD